MEMDSENLKNKNDFENNKHNEKVIIDNEGNMEENENQENDDFEDDKDIDNDDNDEYNENDNLNLNQNLNNDGNQDENDNINLNDNKNIDGGNLRKKPFCRMPVGKIKNIIKMNPDIKLCNKNVYSYLGKAVELLFHDLAFKSSYVTKFNKRRTMNPEDICKLTS